MKRNPWLILISAALVGCSGCGSGDTPNVNAPAAQGVGGVPVMSAEQLNKLPPDRRAQIEQSQAALQKAAAGYRERQQTGRMPSGG